MFVVLRTKLLTQKVVKPEIGFQQPSEEHATTTQLFSGCDDLRIDLASYHLTINGNVDFMQLEQLVSYFLLSWVIINTSSFYFCVDPKNQALCEPVQRFSNKSKNINQRHNSLTRTDCNNSKHSKNILFEK